LASTPDIPALKDPRVPLSSPLLVRSLCMRHQVIPVHHQRPTTLMDPPPLVRWGRRSVRRGSGAWPSQSQSSSAGTTPGRRRYLSGLEGDHLYPRIIQKIDALPEWPLRSPSSSAGTSLAFSQKITNTASREAICVILPSIVFPKSPHRNPTPLSRNPSAPGSGSPSLAGRRLFSA
jgi:hypothetical protein